MADTRTPPPALAITGPSCSLCEEEVSCDGTSYWCDNCAIYWALDGGEPEWDEPDADQCPWLYDTSALGTVRCVLAVGHGERHASDVTGWAWTEGQRGAHLPLVDDDPADGLRAKVLGAIGITVGTWAILHQELGDLARWIL